MLAVRGLSAILLAIRVPSNGAAGVELVAPLRPLHLS